MILFHGNGETVADYIDIYLPVLSKMNINCFISEYRGYSMAGGQPGLVKMLGDVDYIIEAVGKPLEKLVLFGRSIGSLYAIHAASRYPEIPGLIIESGIADIMERLLLRVHPEEIGATYDEIKAAVMRDFNHQGKLSLYKGASLFMHSLGDSLINFSHGEKLFSWASEPKALKLFERGDHNTIFYANEEEYIDALKGFLENV